MKRQIRNESVRAIGFSFIISLMIVKALEPVFGPIELDAVRLAVLCVMCIAGPLAFAWGSAAEDMRRRKRPAHARKIENRTTDTANKAA